MNGSIFNIQRFSTSDGPGIRTTVFFKGCPLSCVWCHNPESHSAKNEIFFDERKCISCGICERICKRSCHVVNHKGHKFSRDSCISCGECAKACPSKSLELCGEEKSADEVLEVVVRDMPFYEQSGGGITLSGGEPLMQFDFALELLKKTKEKGISAAVETSGYCNKHDITKMSEYVDLWLYDIKLFDDDAHKKLTGVSNSQIFENLKKLDSAGANIILRCPIIPDINLNKEHFENIATLANSLKNVSAIHLESYHPLGISKAAILGKTASFDNTDFLSKDVLFDHIHLIQEKTDVKTEVN